MPVRREVELAGGKRADDAERADDGAVVERGQRAVGKADRGDHPLREIDRVGVVEPAQCAIKDRAWLDDQEIAASSEHDGTAAGAAAADGAEIIEGAAIAELNADRADDRGQAAG